MTPSSYAHRRLDGDAASVARRTRRGAARFPATAHRRREKLCRWPSAPLVVLVVALAALAFGKNAAAAGPDPVRAALRAAEATGSIDPARTQAYRSTYHVLNRDLARALCRRTGERAICHAWHSFTAELERRCPRVRPPQSSPSISTRSE
jgi:hypothetical protein